MSILETLVTGIFGAKAADDARDATVAANKEATALLRDQANQARTDFEPFRAFGADAVNGANGLRALLGLGPQSAPPAAVSSRVGFDANAYLQANPDIGAHWNTLTPAQKQQYPTPQAYAAYHYDTHGRTEGRPTGAMAPAAGSNPAPVATSTGNGILDALRATPGYEFRMNEGTRALEGSMAARGLGNSGAAQKAQLRYSQGLADQTYGQAVDRLFQAANVGTGAQAQVTAAGRDAAVGGGNAALNIGAANADRATTRAGIWANGINETIRGVTRAVAGG